MCQVLVCAFWPPIMYQAHGECYISENSNLSKVIYKKQVQNGASDTITLASSHIYILVGGQPYTSGFLGIIAGWNAGASRITWVKDSPFLTATIDGYTVTVTVPSGSSLWVRIIDCGVND